MGMRRYLLLVTVVAVGCEKKDVVPRFEGPMPVTFGDCASATTAWVSGPRPAAFTPADAESIIAQAEPRPPAKPTLPTPTGADDPPPPEEEDATLDKQRREAIEMARNSGGLGATALQQGGAFASITGSDDGGFDDSNIYGGLLGNEAGETGYGFGRSGFGPGGGTGWGTIGTGRYGTIGHGSGTGSGYGVGSGRGGMRGRSSPVPTVSIGQPNTQGDLDKAIIRRYIKRNIQKIQYCYEKQLLVKPGLSGTVSTQFFIAPDGKVPSATGSGVDPEVANCVAGVIKAIEFPKPKGGGGVQVNYPFTFRPAAGYDRVGFGSGSGSAAAPDAGSGSAGSGSGGSASAVTPPATAKRHVYRESGAIDPAYKPGAANPLRSEEAALTECFRRTPTHWGMAVIELGYDATGRATTVAVHGVDDKRLVTCVTTAAKRVTRAVAGAGAQRCSVAFGEMPLASLPAIDITDDAISVGPTKLTDSKSVFEDKWTGKIEVVSELITARLNVATSQPAPVWLHGPLVVRPVETAKMKVVNRVLASILAAGDDFVLAVNKGASWELLTPQALPVVPVPFGTGTVWNPVRARSGSGNSGDERVRLSILVGETSVWVGLSRVNEFTEIKRDAAMLQSLAAALEANKTNALLGGATDVEIAGDDAVTYGAYIAVVQAAVAAGFKWQLTDPASLSARPMR